MLDCRFKYGELELLLDLKIKATHQNLLEILIKYIILTDFLPKINLGFNKLVVNHVMNSSLLLYNQQGEGSIKLEMKKDYQVLHSHLSS